MERKKIDCELEDCDYKTKRISMMYNSEVIIKIKQLKMIKKLKKERKWCMQGSSPCQSGIVII
jgi:hypothetical protein